MLAFIFSNQKLHFINCTASQIYSYYQHRLQQFVSFTIFFAILFADADVPSGPDLKKQQEEAVTSGKIAHSQQVKYATSA